MPRLSQFAAVSLATLLMVSLSHAQQRSISGAPNVAPSANARAAGAAPNPAGLRPIFPAGISSGSGAAVSSDPVAAGNAAAVPSSMSTPVDGGNGTTLDTTVLGAGGLTARGPSQSVPLAGSGLNPVEVARVFLNADTNRDGELTRLETRRLGAGFAFEEWDRNFDGVISRSEYDDGAR